jgi:glycosyltransferase involved in cell wall biosynthesis
MTKILILANHYPVASGRYMADAFRRLGCEVRTMGEPKSNDIWGLKVDPKYIWQQDFDMDPREVMTWTPDLVLQMDTEITYADTIFPNIPHAIFSVDNHVRQITPLGHWKHQFLAHHDGPAQPVCDCPWNTWLPCAYDPIWFTPSPIPMPERAYDVCIVGVPYPRRQVIVQQMAAVGLKVYANVGLLYKEYAEAYQNSRISLCVSAAHDVAQRIYETAAMGCAVLTDRCNDFDRLGFRNGNEGIVFDSDEEAIELAKKLLASPKELKRIASEGQMWARSHTWDARAKTILEKMGLNEEE